jgi:hypothetical protein
MKMKKLKKIFSMALASVMALSLFSMTAFAENEAATPTPTPTEKIVTSIPVDKCVVVKEGAAIPERSFTFTMVPASGNQLKDDNGDDLVIGGQKVKAGVDLTTNSVTYSFNSSDTANKGITTDTTTGITTKVESGKTTKSGLSFDVSNVNFGSTGIFRYYISETVPSDVPEYMIYSEEYYLVDLYVYNGTSANTYTIKGMTITKYDGTVKDSTKPDKIVFTNTIQDNLLTISKTVEGEEYTKDEMFTFYIEIPEGGDTINLEKDTKIYAKIFNGSTWVNDERTESDGIVKLNVNGDPKDVNCKSDGTSFQLKDGEELRIYAPITMIYFVQEEDYSGEGYTQTFTYDESGKKASTTLQPETNNYNDDQSHSCFDTDGNLLTIKGTVNTDTNTVAFTNTRTLTITDTGLNLNLAPYVLITLIAVCGGILFFARKRRVDR